MCGLATAEIAASFVIPEPTMAQRLVRAKRKIRQAGIRLKSPGQPDLPRRLAVVLRVVYLVFTQGHMAQAPDLVRGTLCEQAIRLARALATLMPEEPEVMGLLALLLLADARRGREPAPRVSSSELAGVTVAPPLPNPPWVRWDHADSGVWPAIGCLDNRDHSAVPAYAADTAERARRRIFGAGLPCVLGHADFEAQNLTVARPASVGGT